MTGLRTSRSKFSFALAIALVACERSSPPSPRPRPETAASPAATGQASAPRAAVSQGPPLGSSTLAVPSGSAEPPFVGTVGIVDVKRESAPSLLTALRVAEHEQYDRVVFEFRGGVPGYHVEYVDRPVRDCGAGDVRPIAGDAWLEIRFFPANAHDEQGSPTVRERELHPKLANLLEVERTCDFEAVVTWVLGVKSPNRYRVLELTDPPRLAVDVKH